MLKVIGNRKQRRIRDQDALENKKEILLLFVNQSVQFPSVCIKSSFVFKKKEVRIAESFIQNPSFREAINTPAPQKQKS